MEKLLEEYLGKKLRSFMYNGGVFGNREPHYQCVLEDDTNVIVNTNELWVFIYRLASTKFPKTLEKLSDDPGSGEIYYKLTSKYVLYYGGKSIILNIKDKFRLAGFELSTCGDYSPFHYNDDIIRLPNSIIEKVNE